MKKVCKPQSLTVLVAMTAMLAGSVFNTAQAYSISTLADVYRFSSNYSDHASGTNYAYASSVLDGYHQLSASASATSAGSLGVNANMDIIPTYGSKNAEVSANANFSDIFRVAPTAVTPSADIYATVRMRYTLGWNTTETSVFSTNDLLASLDVFNDFGQHGISFFSAGMVSNPQSGAIISGILESDIMIYSAQRNQWSDIALNMHLGTSRLFSYQGTTSFSGSAHLAAIVVPGEIEISSSSNALVAPVPVPAAVWLFASGLVGLVGVARRQVR